MENIMENTDFLSIPCGSQELLNPNDVCSSMEDLLSKSRTGTTISPEEYQIDDDTITFTLHDDYREYPVEYPPNLEQAQDHLVNSDMMLNGLGGPPPDPPKFCPPAVEPDLRNYCSPSVESDPPKYCPPHLGPPSQEPDPGPFNFTAQISKSKSKCLYSEKLNRMYVQPLCDFAVKFGWGPGAGEDVTFVRACVLFQDSEHAQQRVECCRSHRQPQVEEQIGHNVLHSARALGTAGVAYYGRVDDPDAWYSCVARLPADRSHAFRFVCTNNCSAGGISRRNIAIVFTLEDSSGKVYGRRTIGAKACACPQRDMGKDETAAGLGSKPGKRPALPAPARGKKIKIETPSGLADDVVLDFPQEAFVVGVRPLLAALEAALRMQEQAAALRARDAAFLPRCRAAVASLRDRIHYYRQLYGIH